MENMTKTIELFVNVMKRIVIRPHKTRDGTDNDSGCPLSLKNLKYPEDNVCQSSEKT